MISEQTDVPSRVPLWRGMDRAALDRAYDNSGAVADSSAYLADWSRRSDALRARQGQGLDLRYGPKARNRIDIFRSGIADAPLLVFIHGGYWQRNSKEIFACMAEGPLAAGLDVALVGYTLAPEAGLGEMMEEVRAALTFLRRDEPGMGVGRTRLIVSGWSAGGQLAASVMGMDAIDAGLAISGIFELEPIRLGKLNDPLGLTAADCVALSPLHTIPAHAGELTVAFGTGELPELQRQSHQYLAAWREAGRSGQRLEVKNANHFSILEELAQPGGVLALEAARLAGLR